MLFFFFLPLEPLYAEQRGTVRTKEVIVLFEEPLRVAAEEAATLYPILKKELENTLARPVNFRGWLGPISSWRTPSQRGILW